MSIGGCSTWNSRYQTRWIGKIWAQGGSNSVGSNKITLLTSHTWEGIAVIARQCLHDVFGVLSPGGDLAVGLDPVHQLGATVLQRQRVSVVLIQLLKQPGSHMHTQRGNAVTCWWVRILLDCYLVRWAEKQRVPPSLNAICISSGCMDSNTTELEMALTEGLTSS